MDAASQHRLEDAPQQIALAEAPMSVLREGRVVGHIAIEPEPTKPTIGQIEVNLLAQTPLGADAEAVAYDQHSDHQFGIDRGSTNGAVEWSQLPPQFTKLDEPVDRAQKMIGWNVPFERELIKQSSLFDLPMPHHDSVLSKQTESVSLTSRNQRVFQQNRSLPNIAPHCDDVRFTSQSRDCRSVRERPLRAQFERYILAEIAAR
ncbi:MAG: hypothetical protein QOF14_5730 [Hyphomicrobiales bacterium]|jgi:hypothetical protein|nr:hypothetical protein [Hyphomicrobiales bacterium]